MRTFLVNETSENVWFDQFRIQNTTPVILQETHYDPWGVELQGLGYQQAGIKANKYLYNSKEFNDHLGINLSDYGARLYDASIGRWFVVDPLAERRDWLTPYNYVQNNPMLRVDPLGLTDFKFNKETGEVNQVGDTNGQTDRILKTDRNGIVKIKKNGDPRVAVDKIQTGILENGQNWKTNDQVIEVGGDGQPTVDGVKSFTLKLSEYLGKELKGFSYSADGSKKVSDMVIGKYVNNEFDKSSATVRELRTKYGGDYSNNNVLQEFHTHPGGKLGATQSNPELSTDVKSLQNSKPLMPNASFIILYRLAGQEKPAEYDFTHEYRPKKH